MINNRPEPWKRPLHQRQDQPHQHSPPPPHPRDECPAKRRRDSGPDQVQEARLVRKVLFMMMPDLSFLPPFSRLIPAQGLYCRRHHLAIAATKITGSLFTPEGVRAIIPTTGPQQHSNRDANLMSEQLPNMVIMPSSVLMSVLGFITLYRRPRNRELEDTALSTATPRL